MLKRKPVVLSVILVAVGLIIATAVYYNSNHSKYVSSSNIKPIESSKGEGSPGPSLTQSPEPSISKDNTEKKPDNEPQKAEGTASAEKQGKEPATVSNASGTGSTSAPQEAQKQEPAAKEQQKPAASDAKLPPGADMVQDKAKAITGKDVEFGDFMAAAGIVLKKLSFREIKFLFDSAKDDLFINTSVEELERIRKIIFSKLTSDDLAQLKEIGQRYGKEMKILDPNINVAEEKEKRTKAKEQSSKK